MKSSIDWEAALAMPFLQQERRSVDDAGPGRMLIRKWKLPLAIGRRLPVCLD